MEGKDRLEKLAVLQYLRNAGQEASSEERSIYRAIGVEPIINCRGTFTIIGGSVQRPQAIRLHRATQPAGPLLPSFGAHRGYPPAQR